MSNNSIYAILVDSSLAIRDALPPALQTLANVKVYASAATAREGVNRIREHARAWGLVVLEVGLDCGGGFYLLRSCQGRARHQQVIVFTSYATRWMRAHCLSLGADAVFDKSTELDAFMGYCRKLSVSSRH